MSYLAAGIGNRVVPYETRLIPQDRRWKEFIKRNKVEAAHETLNHYLNKMDGQKFRNE